MVVCPPPRTGRRRVVALREPALLRLQSLVAVADPARVLRRSNWSWRLRFERSHAAFLALARRRLQPARAVLLQVHAAAAADRAPTLLPGLMPPLPHTRSRSGASLSASRSTRSPASPTWWTSTASNAGGTELLAIHAVGRVLPAPRRRARSCDRANSSTKCGPGGCRPSPKRPARRCGCSPAASSRRWCCADRIGIAIDPFFAHVNDPTTAGVWSLPYVWLYALQIYFDFSGYTDMARGFGLLFGYRWPENFNRPYLADLASPISGGAGT